RNSGRGLRLDETLEQMQQGSLMRKVKSKSWKKQRYLELQDDCMTVWHKSKKTGHTKYTFSISDVETVREGHQSEVLQSLAEEFPPEHCFTVVFHGRRGNLDLIAGSPEEAQCWVRGLRRLVEIVTKMDQQEQMDQYPSAGLKADKNRDGRMSFKEVRQLLKMMNMDMNEDHALWLFQVTECTHASASGTLEGEEFVLFYKALTQRDEVLGVFRAFSRDGKKLTLLEFVDFLQQEQLERENTQELAMELMARYEPSETARARHVLSVDGFLLYLRSPEGSIFNPAHGTLYQDMTQPLCHYFISSSHNTYLLEDQLRGQSSIEGYIRAQPPASIQTRTSDMMMITENLISSYKRKGSPDPKGPSPRPRLIGSRRQIGGPVGEGLARLGSHHLRLPPGNAFARHNAGQLTRIYPSGLRTDSSNYDPQEMWNVGCQLVALNVQTAGAEMDLSDGLFRQNGRCGYVLKPAFLRDAGTAFDPDDPRSRAEGGPWRLVISGQQLPKVANSKPSAIVDPLVRVEIHGVPADQARRETQYVENNGFNPSWGETLPFKVHVPELALVRFVVEDYDKASRNDFVAQFTLPFASLKSGYRHVHLLSKDGTAIPPSSLFVHVQITELPRPE
uniref:1-phosphatidylinositol 4,5-bisphosphate phosphodiesterase delta-4 n=1 Tax=Chelydra serpentina TaxID=8475 RepID=A0A8C3TJ78_CHESE